MSRCEEVALRIGLKFTYTTFGEIDDREAINPGATKPDHNGKNAKPRCDGGATRECHASIKVRFEGQYKRLAIDL